MNTVVLDVWDPESGATWDNTVRTILSSQDTKLILWAPQEWALGWNLENIMPARDRFILLKQLRTHMINHNVEIVYVYGSVSGTRYPYINNTGVDSPLLANEETWLPGTIHRWPTYWLQSGISNYIYNSDRTWPYRYSEFNQLFVCMQSRPHVHRLYLQDQLYQSGLLYKNHCSWNVLASDYYNNPGAIYNFEHWDEHQMIIDSQLHSHSHGTGLCTSVLSRSDPVNYTGCFMDLISESSTESCFITEKSVKPLLSHKPFLIVGAVGIHAAMADLGFELYDEIFDYSFDTITDSAERIDAIVCQLAQLQLRYEQGSLQLYPAYMQLLPKLHRNFVRLHEIVVNHELMPDFVKHNPDLFPKVPQIFHAANDLKHADWVQQFIKSDNS